MKNERIIFKDTGKINLELEAVAAKRRYSQAVADAYRRETEGNEGFPELTLDLLTAIIQRPETLDQLAYEALPTVVVDGVPLKREMLDITPLAFTETKQAIEEHKFYRRRAFYGAALDNQCYILSEDYQLSVSENWKAEVEETFTQRAETPVEQYVFDALEEIQAIVAAVKDRTGLNIPLEKLTYPGDRKKFKPMKEMLPRSLRSRGVKPPTGLVALNEEPEAAMYGKPGMGSRRSLGGINISVKS